MFDIIQTATNVRIDKNKLPFQTLQLDAALKYDSVEQSVFVEDSQGRSIRLKSRDVDTTVTFGGAIIPFTGTNQDLIDLLISDFFNDPREGGGGTVTSDDVINLSGVTGANDTEALNNLNAAIQGIIFGNDYQFARNEATTSTTSQTYQNKLTLNAVGLVIGATYKVSFYAEIGIAATNRSVLARAQIDGTDIAEVEIENKDNNNVHTFSGFDTFITVSSNPVITIDFRKQGGGGALAFIRKSRLEIFRIL